MNSQFRSGGAARAALCPARAKLGARWRVSHINDDDVQHKHARTFVCRVHACARRETIDRDSEVRMLARLHADTMNMCANDVPHCNCAYTRTSCRVVRACVTEVRAKTHHLACN